MTTSPPSSVSAPRACEQGGSKSNEVKRSTLMSTYRSAFAALPVLFLADGLTSRSKPIRSWSGTCPTGPPNSAKLSCLMMGAIFRGTILMLPVNLALCGLLEQFSRHSQTLHGRICIEPCGSDLTHNLVRSARACPRADCGIRSC